MTKQKDYTALFLFTACCLAILAFQLMNFSSQVALQRSIDELSVRVEAANRVNEGISIR